MKWQATTRRIFGEARFGSKRTWGIAAVAVLALRSVACSSDNPAAGPDGAGGLGAGNGGGPAAVCGNNVVEPGEECDGTVQTTCAAATMSVAVAGTVKCTACHVDLSGCTATVSGAGGAPAVGAAGTTAASTGGGPVISSNGGTSSTSSGGIPGSAGSGSGGTFGSGGTTGGGGTLGGGGISTAGSGGAAGSTSNGGSSGVLGDVDMLRQTCVDTINMYRATKMLAPLTRASASVEACSDMGAQSDGTTMVAHGSAGKCPGMSAQDTCPGWPPQQYGGAAGALKACLQSMWNEGEPPEGRDMCLQEYFSGNIACFEKYGHYLNMSDPSNTVVSCGFFVMSSGALWMNQDLGH
ncbi:MAG TPA: hypothetical protein VHC69_33165 [Polyangiaceae bacterium]|nr:hypothetical protein [Polyangiaceae bacterium]